MTSVIVQANLYITLEEAWAVLSEIEHYAIYNNKYIQKVVMHGPVALGTKWDDWTTVLWLQLKVKHTITVFEPSYRIGYDVDLLFGGKQQQLYILERDGKASKVTCRIDFDLRNFFANFFIGPILKKRLHDMVQYHILKGQETAVKKR